MSEGEKNTIGLPSITLPKGGGAIQGIGEKFSNNPVTGTASLAIPLPESPGRASMQPGLGLHYDSGNGNGPFGLGWSLSLPIIQRRTSQGLPRYDDNDVFQLAGAEDLVPVIAGHPMPRQEGGRTFDVQRYRPRIDGTYARIERWTDQLTGEVHWRTLSPGNLLSIFGQTANARVTNPEAPLQVFQWLLEEVRDNKGQTMVYEYVSENATGITPAQVEETPRLAAGNAFAQKYLKAVRYGNAPGLSSSGWHFHLILDYGEHDLLQPLINASPGKTWTTRPDAFSNYRAGFEIRTWRLCRRALVFHDFPELGPAPVLVRSLLLTHELRTDATLLTSAQLHGHNGNETKALPPTEFHYQAATFHSTVQQLTDGPYEGRINGTGHQWADLFAEGMPGLLHVEGHALRYSKNLGGGTFAPAKAVGTFPMALNDLSSANLMDLDGDGNLELLVTGGAASGFYTIKGERWQPSRWLKQSPPAALANPETKWLDLDGDGKPDLLVTEEQVFSYYLNRDTGLGQHGRRRLPLEEEGRPICLLNDHRQAYYFADMSGDGLSDLVRVRRDSVCYWPNLGYGRFGDRVMMRDAPLLDSADHFSTSFIQLADLDGSGPADLVYFGQENVAIYSNRAGNAWQLAIEFPSPVPRDNFQELDLVDLLGNGTVCMVWTSDVAREPAGLRYIDLLGSKKPWLLNRVTNGLGAETLYEYGSSTKFYREDAARGKPWITRLPFPVHVVTQVQTFDHLSGARFSKRFAYHHGYYDGKEREFRGFGMVEQWDTEEYEWFVQAGNEISEDYYVPPVRTCTWFHTGSWTERDVVSKQYQNDYYTGDPLAPRLPDSIILNQAFLTIAEQQEAYRAMRGMMIRQEVYAEDQSGLAEIPYSVVENRVRVRCLQRMQGQPHAVFTSEPLESISLTYDRNPSDPRISHEAVLRIDDYGVPLFKVSLAYPRRYVNGRLPEQSRLYATASVQEVLHHDDEDWYQLSIPITAKTFELGGLQPDGPIFSWSALQSQATAAVDHPIPNEETLNGLSRQARLLSHTNNIYWNSTLAGALQLGEALSFPPLLHHEEQMAFTRAHFLRVFENRVSRHKLYKGGYRLIDDAVWIWGPIVSWTQQNGSYLPVRTRDNWRNETTVGYDRYGILPINATNALGQVSEGQPDYRTLSYRNVTDPNRSVSEAITDALGLVIATSMHGDRLGVLQGDLPLSSYTVQQPTGLDEVVSNPQRFIQGASSFFYYDIWAYQTRGEAPSSIGLAREVHARQQLNSPVQMALSYNDGLGRPLQSKLRVEAGPAFLRNPDGTLQLAAGKPVLGTGAVRWLSSSRVLLNNKGKPVKQWEPFFSSTHHYEPEQEVTRYGISPFLHYDAIGRVIRTDFPDGTFATASFSPWQQTQHDATDNVLLSDWYAQRGSPSPTLAEPTTDPVQRAAWRSAQNANTPTIAHLDNLGRVVQAEAVVGNGRRLISTTTFDIIGQPLTQTDARQYALNTSRQSTVHSFVNVYGMGGIPFTTWSADAGFSWTLPDCTGQPWRGGHQGLYTEVKRDALRRPVRIIERYGGRAVTSEAIIYGDEQPDAAARNLIGQVWQHFHPGGMDETLEVNFKGEVIRKQTRLVSSYRQDPDWSVLDTLIAPVESLLEPTAYTFKATTNALGRLLEKVEADGTRIVPTYYESGLLCSLTATPGSIPDSPLSGPPAAIPAVAEVLYNEKGQRSRITYGNGVVTTYTYDPITFRIIEVKTLKGTALKQHLFYTYDAGGNITHIRDEAFKVVFNNNQAVEANGDYYYDALNQLVKATGRQHDSILPNAAYNDSWASPWLNIINPQANANDPSRCSKYTQEFSYDDAGNLVQFKHRGTTLRTMAVSPESNRAVLQDNLGTRTVDSFFDRKGNLKEMEHLRAIRWNGRNELIAAVKVARTAPEVSDAEYYVYDAGGQRIRKVSETLEQSGTRIRVDERIYLGGIEITRKYYRYPSGSPDTQAECRYTLHVMDDKQRVALVHRWTIDTSDGMAGQTRVHYQLSNQLGSAAMELDTAGALISYEEYFPYGDTSFIYSRSQVEIKWKHYRYTGMERDATGLNYHSARYYAPWIGRWLNPDPAGTVDGLNLYRYVRGNPVNLNDPSGKAPPGTVTLYRGEGVGVPRVNEGNVAFHDLGDGYYWTDDLYVAREYGNERMLQNEVDGLVKQTVVDTSGMRILDLTTDPRWERFLAKQGVDKKILLWSENYGATFQGFLNEHKINLNDFDLIIGEEARLGGKQYVFRGNAANILNEKVIETMRLSGTVRNVVPSTAVERGPVAPVERGPVAPMERGPSPTTAVDETPSPSMFPEGGPGGTSAFDDLARVEGRAVRPSTSGAGLATGLFLAGVGIGAGMMYEYAIQEGDISAASTYLMVQLLADPIGFALLWQIDPDPRYMELLWRRDVSEVGVRGAHLRWYPTWDESDVQRYYPGCGQNDDPEDACP
ncbi:MAG: SpvB/TcaC N-terminal domain-containing protein [Bacteroidia bacterium]